MEVIVVDDHSSDSTVQVASSFPVQVMELKDHYWSSEYATGKKPAITLGVQKAKGEFILVLDADCIPTSIWIETHIHCALTQDSVFQTGPVLIKEAGNKWEWMQHFEFLTLMLITGAGLQLKKHGLANGGNMLFKKEAFGKVKGFEGNLHIPSGDDLFLVEKMKQHYPDQIHFVKNQNAIVLTPAKADLQSLLVQRLRWMKKNSQLKDHSIERTWWFVGLIHIWILVLLILTVAGILPFWILGTFLLLKWLADAWVIKAASKFSSVRNNWARFIPSQILYGWYLFQLLLQSIFKFTPTSTQSQRGFQS